MHALPTVSIQPRHAQPNRSAHAIGMPFQREWSGRLCLLTRLLFAPNPLVGMPHRVPLIRFRYGLQEAAHAAAAVTGNTARVASSGLPAKFGARLLSDAEIETIRFGVATAPTPIGQKAGTSAKRNKA